MHVGIVACNHVNTVTKSFLLTDNTIGKCSTLLSCFSEARELNVELSIVWFGQQVKVLSVRMKKILFWRVEVHTLVSEGWNLSWPP